MWTKVKERKNVTSGFGFPRGNSEQTNVGLWHSLVLLPFVLSFFRLKNVVASSIEKQLPEYNR